jgi:ADP-glucose pyrophosphorylase
VPGSTERDRDYWRDVGTLDAYYEANMDLISVHPVFNLYNFKWPTLTHIDAALPPAKFVYDSGPDRVGQAIDSFVSAGVIISGGTVRRSVLSPMVFVHSWATIDDSVLLDGVRVGRGAKVSRAILDKNVVVEEGATVGLDREKDLANGLTVTKSGITVAPKGLVIPR